MAENLIKKIYKLRGDFVIIALTGRTGSGCSTVADILTTTDFSSLKTIHREKGNRQITNDIRKHEIVYNFLTSGNNWVPFTKITASDVIFWYALKMDFKEFKNSLASNASEVRAEEIKKVVDEIEESYNHLHEKADEYMKYIRDKEYYRSDKEKAQKYISEIENFVFIQIPEFRKLLNSELGKIDKKAITAELQRWGNNIRRFDSVDIPANGEIAHYAPACLARTINLLCKAIRWRNNDFPTRIVIDALRNPFEILYFRERFSAFYTMAVNTDKEIRYKKLNLKGIDYHGAESIDNSEKTSGSLNNTYQQIDVDRCIELSDIFITHDGTEAKRNRELVTQIAQYVALILHPGLVPPSPIERVMQVAYTAKLNSGCLSRQVGAAVTNDAFSVQAIGWNTSAEGQTPCSLRNLFDLVNIEDEDAYSKFEKDNKSFFEYAAELTSIYKSKREDPDTGSLLKSIGQPYCFKDLYTTINPKQKGNQVHTRSLHAEENAFLQLAKYGDVGIEGGKLFTTASCCELCGKKAFQLGIREIYYIDSYPGITRDHILECGQNRPKMILFHGAIGSAYNSLYEPFIPLKDEISELSGVNPKSPVDFRRNKDQKGELTAPLQVINDSPKVFINDFVDYIQCDINHRWIIDEEGDITLRNKDWRMLAWFRMKPFGPPEAEKSGVEFRLINSNKDLKKEGYSREEIASEYYGKLISTLFSKFGTQISEILRPAVIK